MYLKEKNIKGKKYTYLTKSIRLPDGKVKTLQKLIKDKTRNLKLLENKYCDLFIKKEKKAFSDFALNKYRLDAIFNENEINKIEYMRIDYRYIIKKLTKEQLRDLFDRFIANFTYESNAIEGNSLTLKDVAIVMFENRTIEGKDMREIYETRNSRSVMNLILKNKFGIKEKNIIKIHSLLMEDIDIRKGYKKIPNYIVGSNVKLTAPEKVEEQMKELIRWYGNNIKNLPLLKISALFHGKFERIHPFEDGNGRVGRFLSNIILLSHNYPPLIIRKTQRESYIKCLEDFHRGYSANLERFFLEKYKMTFKKFFSVYLKYIK